MISNRTESDAYLFGDTELAAERLRLLAEVFAPSTREFLEQLVPHDPRAILDLGCGPGYTTRLLAEVFPQARVLGVDNSKHFLALANRLASDRIFYQMADVTTRLPAGPCDLIYCRYLLTHLAQPLAALELWGQHLRPLGLIAIEENDWIRTDEPALAKYLSIVGAMLAAAGRQLYLGPQLDAHPVSNLLVKIDSALKSVRVSARDAARMFVMNLETWRHQTYIEQHHSLDEMTQLAADLRRLADNDSPVSSITFGLRRVLLQANSR